MAQLEIKDPLAEKIAEIGGQDFEYVTLLQHVENKTGQNQGWARIRAELDDHYKLCKACKIIEFLEPRNLMKLT